ncbi:MAG: CapA family protein [Clostridia bacterium]|nr:CapA family protein [Clostridia bacterium]
MSKIKIYIKNIILLSVLAALLAAALLSGCAQQNEIIIEETAIPTLTPQATATVEPTPEPTAVPQPIEIIIGGTGDIMVHKRQLEDAKYTAKFEEGYEYYFKHNFKYIKDALQYPDLMIGNLETVFASQSAEYSGWPDFNTPDIFAYELKEAGFDVLTNSNNHALDRGKDGLLRTISILDENSLYHTGTFDSIESYNTPIVIDVNGVKVGVMSGAYAYQHINSLTPEEQQYMISVNEAEYLKKEVADLKSAGAQIIVASMHWGYEDTYEIYDDQAELAPLLVAAGVDIIFGHHPHILQPIEYMEVTLDDGTVNSAVVCWSLGNFLATSYKRLQQEGAICYVYLSFDPVTEEVTINKTQVLPTYVDNNYTYLYDYHVFPSGTAIEKMNIDDFSVPKDFAKTLSLKYADVMESITGGYVEFISEVPQK